MFSIHFPKTLTILLGLLLFSTRMVKQLIPPCGIGKA